MPTQTDGDCEYDAELWEIALRPLRDPLTIECRCGEPLTLDSAWENACGHCGQLYNGAGQALAPRECWGEETDEHF